MAPENLVGTNCGWVVAAATVNGHGRVATARIVGPEGVIFATNPGRKTRHPQMLEAEATA